MLSIVYFGKCIEFKMSLTNRDLENLPPEKRKALDEIYEEYLNENSIDFDETEVKDIQDAVYEMLQRIITRLNNRGIFSVSYIQPCGSMAEKIGTWRVDITKNETYAEFDYLAVLENSANYHSDCNFGDTLPCRGCAPIKTPPIKEKLLRRFYGSTEFDINSLSKPRGLYDLFLRETFECLTASCKCFSSTFRRKRVNFSYYNVVSVTPNAQQLNTECKECSVTKPSGYLTPNTNIVVDESSKGQAKCSLIFLWKSTSKTLHLPVPMPGTPKRIDTLPIYVDFSPALRIFASVSSSENDHAPEMLIVSKHCSVCMSFNKWRKSNCVAEMNAMDKMSKKHKNCFKILKYLLPFGCYSGRPEPSGLKYHLKIKTLDHSTKCSDSAGYTRSDCLLKILAELAQAYTLGEFTTGSNILQSDYTAATSYVLSIRENVQKIVSVKLNFVLKP